MKIKQCELVDDANHTSVAWLDASKPLKAGAIVTGKDIHTGKDNKTWRITLVYQTVCDLADIHLDWEVGGLDEKPRS